MLSVKLFICLATVYVGANAAVGIILPQEKPAKFANLKGCYEPEMDRVLEFGEHYTPLGHCVRYSCYNDGGIQIASCGSIGVGPGCEIAAGNTSLPYPKCCDGIKCKKSDGTYVYDFS